MSFTEGEGNEVGEEGKAKRNTCWRLCGLLRMLSGWLPEVWALIHLHSLPFRRCFYALIWLPLVRPAEEQDASLETHPMGFMARCGCRHSVLTCLTNGRALLSFVILARQPAS